MPLGDIKEKRKLIIGRILSGLLIGILLSRTFSGLSGGTYGWRNVYLIAAMMMVILMILLRKLLPICEPVSKIIYKELLKLMIVLIKSEPVLRESCINGAMMFLAFNAFWTSLIFLLKSSTYNMGAKEAGLFGIVGINGALRRHWLEKWQIKKVLNLR